MEKQYVYFLKGLPASGKSSWAKQKIEEDRNNGITTKRINKDDLRAMLDNSFFSKEREKFILKARDNLLSLSLVNGYNVIIDDTNFEPKHLKKVEEVIQHVRYALNLKVEIVEKFFDTPVSECIERDSNRNNAVGRKVIMGMYNRYFKEEKSEEQMKYNPDLPDCIIVDVDGTLALRESNRSPFEYWKADRDKLNKPIADLVKSLRTPNTKVIIMTGRENLCDEDGWTVSDLTQRWLRENDVYYDDIFIRKEGDHRADFKVKKEMYENHIKGNYNVLYVIDDRRQVIDMYREQGLTVLDVAGNDF